MEFEEIKLKEMEIDNNYFQWEIWATNELIDTANAIRSSVGNEDLVGIIYDNDVFYNFYLNVDFKRQEIFLDFSVSCSKEDNYYWYSIDITLEEKEMLMWAAIKELNKELLK